MIYLIGSLRNANVPCVATALRVAFYDVFDDWYGAGPQADDHWRELQQLHGRTYKEALAGPAAQHVFRFDKLHLDKADTVVLVMPAGKSGHLEFGYAIGMGKKGYVLFDKEPERWDVMYNFATGVAFGVDDLIEQLGA